MDIPLQNPMKAPAKVLGCLRSGYLTLLVGHGLGMADGGVPSEISIDLVPDDLRLPNSKFTVLLDACGRFIGVEK